MTLNELIKYWKSDYKRYSRYGAGRWSILLFTPGFVYCFYMRLCKYLKTSRYHKLYFPLFIICRLILGHLVYKFGILIPYTTQIGYGLYIGHFGNIFVNPRTVIGNNVNLSQCITVGEKDDGVPVIGNDVFIGTGAVIFGNISIGNNVAVGANCVVTKSIPDNAIVVGVPGKIISFKGNRHRTTITN